MERHPDAIEVERLAIGRSLHGTRKIVAVPDTHDVERLAGREHVSMAGTGMVRMTVRDQRPPNRADRVDEKVAGRAIEPLGPGMQKVAGAHCLKIGICSGRGSLLNRSPDSAI